MRSLLKSWQSERPMTRTTRRVRWYEGDGTVRLCFDDALGLANRIYTDPDEARVVYAAYQRGDYDSLHVPKPEEPHA